MVARRFPREKTRRCSALLLLMAAAAAPGGAQLASKAQAPPAPRAIILPPKAVAGETGTLAVLDSQGRLLPHVTVELSGGEKVTTDSTGRALFKAPVQPRILMAKIPGHGVTASTPLLAPASPGPEGAPSAPADAKLLSYPSVVAIHDQFALEGSAFRGAADANRIFLADQPCLVLAASPVSLVALPGPHVPIGGVDLRVRVDGREAAPKHVSVALLEFSGPPGAPNAGTTGQIRLRARGTTEKLLVEVRNGSPAVIQLPKGNVQQIRTSGGDENVAPVEVRYLTSGSYLVIARLISAEGNSAPN